jgi:FMN phosphatase YigB (HAD superfamily)
MEIIIDSKVVGVEKPDPAIFAIALEATGTVPDRTMHMGDTLVADVVGALAASQGVPGLGGSADRLSERPPALDALFSSSPLVMARYISRLGPGGLSRP